MNEGAAAAFQAERQHLFGVAYRMLGSAAEAEDILQDAFMRFSEQRHVDSPRGFLTTVVVRLCLDHLKTARSRRERYVGPWLPEPLLEKVDSGENKTPDEQIERAESISLAFLLLLERLSPLERAAFLLREVFEQSFAEVAETLGASEDACRQLVSRAHRHVDEGRARFRASEEKKRALLESFVGACISGDASQLSVLLAEDVVARSDGGGKALAALKPIYGRDRVTRFCLGLARKAANVVPAFGRVNGEPGLLLLEGDCVKVAMVLVPSVGDEPGKIAELLIVTNPEKLTR